MNKNVSKIETASDGTVHFMAVCANVRDAFSAIESITAYLNSIRERTQKPVVLPNVPDLPGSPMDTLGKEPTKNSVRAAMKSESEESNA